jgi:hypothetical protein
MNTPVKHLATLLFILVSGSIAAQNFYKERISRDNIVTIALGPSFAYIDNGGQYRDLNFSVKPAFSVSLTNKLSEFLELRATTGVQWISSGGNPPFALRDKWFFGNSAFTAKGPAYFFDLVPSFYLVPFSNHMHRSKVNLYGGAGLGVMHVRTQQTKSFSPEETPTSHQITTGYVPVRAGLSLRIGPYSDLAGEGTMMWTLTDNLDGNVGNNRYGDHLFQAQLVYRRYFIPKTQE